jgi:DNA-binding NarL/FixJ family response regulator
MTAHPLGVLVVDDSDVLRTVVSSYLDDELDLRVVASVGTAREAVASTGRLRPDVILLDQDMPGDSGLDVLPELRSLSPDARIVVFSAVDGIRHDALRLGADEFVGKQSPFHEVAEVLRAR